jgi:N-acetylneuraminic acid mutarotase
LKSIYLFVLLSIWYTSYSQNWIEVSEFPGSPRDDGTGFIINNTAFVGTGLSQWWSNEADFYGFDLSSEHWYGIASIPVSEARQYACGFSVNNLGYLFGGYNGMEFLNDLWCYDPISNSWTIKTALPSVGRAGSSCFVIDNLVYIVGGKTVESTAIDEVWCYNPSEDSWTQKNTLTYGKIWRAASTILANKGYIIFGKTENNEYKNNLFEYNPVSDSWTEISIFPAQGRTHASLFSLDNSLFVCFGIDTFSNSFNDLWQFDLSSSSWTLLPGIPSIGRRGGVSFVKNNFFYYSTGIDENNNRLMETWKFSPTLSIIPAENEVKLKLIKVFDWTGKECEVIPNKLLFYQFSDGSIKKIIIN